MIQFVRMTQATLVNAVTIFGVFGAHWTVATAIALYWCENVVYIVLLAVLFALYHLYDSTARGELGELLGVAAFFTLAHGIFLGALLFLFFPRIAPGEQFRKGEFVVGLVLIGGLMLFNFVVDALLHRFATYSDIEATSEGFISRVVVVHLTIIFGMFAMAIFGHARALFAVFCSLKLLSDLGARRTSRVAVTA